MNARGCTYMVHLVRAVVVGSAATGWLAGERLAVLVMKHLNLDIRILSND
jgi:hypothetical protein